METSNYTYVGWNFLIASIFYLSLFLIFFTKNTKKNKNKDNSIEVPINENDNNIDKSEPFIEGRI